MLECKDLVKFLLERADEALLVVLGPVFRRCLETGFELVVCNVGMVVVLDQGATELLTEPGGKKLSVEKHWKLKRHWPRTCMTCIVPHLAGLALGEQHRAGNNNWQTTHAVSVLSEACAEQNHFYFTKSSNAPPLRSLAESLRSSLFRVARGWSQSFD